MSTIAPKDYFSMKTVLYHQDWLNLPPHSAVYHKPCILDSLVCNNPVSLFNYRWSMLSFLGAEASTPEPWLPNPSFFVWLCVCLFFILSLSQAGQSLDCARTQQRDKWECPRGSEASMNIGHCSSISITYFKRIHLVRVVHQTRSSPDRLSWMATVTWAGMSTTDSCVNTWPIGSGNIRCGFTRGSVSLRGGLWGFKSSRQSPAVCQSGHRTLSSSQAPRRHHTAMLPPMIMD